MKELLPGVVTGITYPPTLVVNERRKGLFDVFEGDSKDRFNDFFKYSNLNVTLVDSGKSGACHSDGSCSGMIEALRTGKADFALFPTAIDFPAGFNITYNYPVYVDPMVDEVVVAFLSAPYQRSYKMDRDIMFTLKDISWLVALMQVLTFITVSILLNVTFRSRKKTFLFRLGKRFSWISVYGLFMKQVSLRTMRLSQGMCVSGTIFYLLFMTAAFAGFFQSNMIYEYPPKYYSSLEEIVQRVHNKSVIIIEGLIFDSELIHLNGSVFEKIGKISVTHGRESTAP